MEIYLGLRDQGIICEMIHVLIRKVLINRDTMILGQGRFETGFPFYDGGDDLRVGIGRDSNAPRIKPLLPLRCNSLINLKDELKRPRCVL